MKAIKGNKVYRVDKNLKDKYKQEGFDIYNDEGELIEASSTKTVSYKEYEEIQKELEEVKKVPNNAKALKEQNAELLVTIEKQKVTIADLQKELKETKKNK